MEIAGKIIAVLEARSGVSKTSGNEWKTQEYVLETQEQFPRRMCFNVFGSDKISQFNIQVGEELTVSFDINAREYNGRWYNDIRAWKVERGIAEGQPAPAAADGGASAPAAAPAATAAPTSLESDDPTDDLPF